MAVTADSVRSAVPVPKLKNATAAAWLGFGLFLLGAIWLYDAYDGRGRQGPWPISTLFPWQATMTAPWTLVWFYNSITGAVISEPAFGDTIQSHLPGWHGPFGSKQEALNFYAANAAANPGWKAPTGFAGNLGNEASSAASSALGNGFRLAFGNTGGLLGRILKVGLGVVLLIAGVLKLSGTDRKLEAVIPLVGGPAGKVLRA